MHAAHRPSHLLPGAHDAVAPYTFTRNFLISAGIFIFPYHKLRFNDLVLGWRAILAIARLLFCRAPQVWVVSWENVDSSEQNVAKDTWSSPLDRKNIGARDGTKIMCAHTENKLKERNAKAS